MKSCLFTFLVTLGLLLGPNPSLPLARAEAITMATIDFCPFTCDPHTEGGREGFMTDVVRYALDRAGYELELAMLPYVRAVNGTREGLFDGLVVVGKQYAPDLVYPEIPVVSQRVVFIVKKGTDWRYEGVDSLKTMRIGIVRGYHYVDEDLQEYLLDGKNAPMVSVLHGRNTTERSVQKLLKGRLDVFLEGEFSALYVLHKLGVEDQVVFAGYTNNAFDDYVGFSPKSREADELAALLTRTIRELKETGKLQELLSPYLGDSALNH